MSRNIKGIVSTDRSISKPLPKLVRLNPNTVQPGVLQKLDIPPAEPETSPQNESLNRVEGFDPNEHKSSNISSKSLGDNISKKPIKRKLVDDNSLSYNNDEDNDVPYEKSIDISNRSLNKIDMEADKTIKSGDTSRNGTHEVNMSKLEYLQRTGADTANTPLLITDMYEDENHQMMTNPNRDYSLSTSDPTYVNLDDKPKVSRKDKKRAYSKVADAINKYGTTNSRLPIGLGAEQMYGDRGGTGEAVRNKQTGLNRDRKMAKMSPEYNNMKSLDGDETVDLKVYSTYPITRKGARVRDLERRDAYISRQGVKVPGSSYDLPLTRITNRNNYKFDLPLLRRTTANIYY